MYLETWPKDTLWCHSSWFTDIHAASLLGLMLESWFRQLRNSSLLTLTLDFEDKLTRIKQTGVKDTDYIDSGIFCIHTGIVEVVHVNRSLSYCYDMWRKCALQGPVKYPIVTEAHVPMHPVSEDKQTQGVAKYALQYIKCCASLPLSSILQQDAHVLQLRDHWHLKDRMIVSTGVRSAPTLADPLTASILCCGQACAHTEQVWFDLICTADSGCISLAIIMFAELFLWQDTEASRGSLQGLVQHQFQCWSYCIWL